MPEHALLEPASLGVGVIPPTEVTVRESFDAATAARWNGFLTERPGARVVHRAEWAAIFRDGLGHQPKFLEATENGRIVGVMPLVFMKSLLFGRFLVSSPYVNVGGPVAENERIEGLLISKAVELADELDVDRLELRNEKEIDHPFLTVKRTDKKIMLRPLPETTEELLKGYGSLFRSKVLRGERNGVEFSFGGVELLDDFYDVFAVNMRDLGTPVFGKSLFRSILTELNGDAELCIGRLKGEAVSGGLIWHGSEGTEVPSSSTLRSVSKSGANMSLFGQLLKRAVERGSRRFDFGRSSEGSGTYEFKTNWGAAPSPSVWQSYVRRGEVGDLRPEHPRFQRKIEMWKKLPVWLSRLCGPSIVRGIP
jgi:serine/alanine adding enzyme